MTMYNEDRMTSSTSLDALRERARLVRDRVAKGIGPNGVVPIETNPDILRGIFGDSQRADWSDKRPKRTYNQAPPQGKRHVRSRNKFTSQRQANDQYGTLRANGVIERSASGAKSPKRLRRLAHEGELGNAG